MLSVTPRELLGNELHKPGELRLLAPNEMVQELLLRQDILRNLLHNTPADAEISSCKQSLDKDQCE